MVDGEKMSKSKGNFYKLSDIEKKGYDPLALRYLYMTTHYRAFFNFTWAGLDAAQKALTELRDRVGQLSAGNYRSLSRKAEAFKNTFDSGIGTDLNIPVGLSVLWQVVKSDLPDGDKRMLLLDFDRVLGLRLDEIKNEDIKLPAGIQALIDKREALRKEKNSVSLM